METETEKRNDSHEFLIFVVIAVVVFGGMWWLCNVRKPTSNQQFAYYPSIQRYEAPADPRIKELLTRLSHKFSESESTITRMTSNAQKLLSKQNISMSNYEIMSMADAAVIQSGTNIQYAEILALYAQFRKAQNHAQAAETIHSLLRSMGL